MTGYVFESADELAREHLGRLEEALDPLTFGRLRDRGAGPGRRCLEIGAGSGSVARWLADRAGSSGSVVATDTDLRWLRRLERGNVEVLDHDVVRDPLPDAEFDLVHARLVLILLREREEVLERLVRTLKPGGVLLLEDFDVAGSGTLTSPETRDRDVFDRVLDTYLAVMAEAGAELHWGRRLYGVLRETGLRDVRSTGQADAWQSGSPGCGLLKVNFTQLREQILATGQVSESEWERAVELLDDERFAMRSFLVVGNSGRR